MHFRKTTLKSGVKSKISPVANNNSRSEHSKLDFSWVSLATLCITLFFALVYSVGKAYRNAYLGHYGVAESLVPWALQDIAYLGVVKKLDVYVLAPYIGMPVLALCFVVLSMVPKFSEKLNEWIGVKRNSARKVADSYQQYLWHAFSFFLIGLAFVFLYLFASMILAADAEALGTQKAKEEIALMDRNSAKKPDMVFATITRVLGGKNVVESGYLVSCSERMCALYDPTSADKSKLVPLDSVRSFYTR